jgi:hypothetical protein
VPIFGAASLNLTMKGANSNAFALQAGQVVYPNSYIVQQIPGQGVTAAGAMYLKGGRFTDLQLFDPIMQIWRNQGDDGNAMRHIYTDGGNIRLANSTGCAVAATVTTAGSSYTTVPTVTASAGGSVWRAVLGPLVSTTVTINSGGSTYTYPPIVVIDAPPAGGVPATGYATLSGTTVSTITITNQGAGYSGGVPNIRLVTDPRDTTGSGAVATAALTGANTVAAVLCVDFGNPITSGTVPTLTFGSGSAAATALMNWGVQTYSVTTAGAGYGTSAYIGATGVGPTTVASPAYTNPDIQDNYVRVRQANIWVPTNASGGLVTAGSVIVDGGVYRGIPTPAYQLPLAAATTVGALAFTMGGFNDTVFVQPF